MYTTKNEVKQTRRQFVQLAALAGLGLVTTGLIGFGATRHAFADEEQAESGEVAFDLSKREAQTFTVTNPDGSKDTFGIEPVQQTRSTDSQYLGDGSGTWKAFWYTGPVNLSFYITTENYQITSCYGAFAGGIGSSIAVEFTGGPYLSWSAYQCIYNVYYRELAFGTSAQKVIVGNIQGSYLVYTYCTY